MLCWFLSVDIHLKNHRYVNLSRAVHMKVIKDVRGEIIDLFLLTKYCSPRLLYGTNAALTI